ncbi:MAG: carboxypeptidase regulatory-like domain-containing protein [Microcoleaceae cyanobacterium MO_207.B10]|nr:carboxypeptidase regulatory-like domain-containing protein [Microcoleaceae cyanobacterium MO_207.B10]
MKWQLVIPLIFLSSLSLQGKAMAHGVKIKHQFTPAIKINAAFDSGTPFNNAEVIVYAPNDPAKPWLKGTTDNQGNFIFSPDSSLSGYWEIQVRQAGHGGMVSVPFGVDKSHKNANYRSNYLASSSGDYNPLQKGLMIGSVIWGFVGTALFFSRFRNQQRPQEEH